jgi:hypothetical protein
MTVGMGAVAALLSVFAGVINSLGGGKIGAGGSATGTGPLITGQFARMTPSASGFGSGFGFSS